MNGKYVIGGGLSGLIFGYYNPEYTVLTDSFGGFINNRIARSFIYLHETEATWSLLNDLDVDSFVKELKIAYYHHDTGLSPEPADGFAEDYLPRKIPGEWVPEKVELSAPGDEFRGVFVDENLVDVMKNEVDSRIGYVHEITEDHIFFGQDPVPPEGVSYDGERNHKLDWDSIVSTVPAPVFERFVVGDTGWTLDSEPVTYAELEQIPDRYRELPWNLLYIVDEVPYHRVMRNMLSGKFYAEMRGEVDFGPAETVTHPTGVIHDEDLVAPFEGIEFLGRFAEWSSNVRQDHTIERAIGGFE